MRIVRTKNERIHFSEDQEIRICDMGRNGGFSRKGIAKNLFGLGDKQYDPSDAEINSISRVWSKYGIRVWNWRNCDSKESKLFVASLLRMKNRKNKIAF